MIKSIPLGQYYPGNSPLHRLNGRTKITCLLLYYIVLFTACDLWTYSFLVLFSAGLLLASRVPLKNYWRSSRLIIFLIVFVAFFNAFFTEGQTIWQWYFLDLTVEGLIRAGQMAIRVTLLVVMSSVLTFTTTSVMLTDSMEAMLKPLERVRFPAHDMAMMMSIALRFIPTFIEEADKIYKAQWSRGVDFARGGLRGLARGLAPLIVPLFLSAFRCSEELACAMDARAYRGGVGRTHLRELHLAPRDYLTLALFLLLAAGGATYRILS